MQKLKSSSFRGDRRSARKSHQHNNVTTYLISHLSEQMRHCEGVLLPITKVSTSVER